MPIRRLPPELVNQIAAGEVVERPASVVKELLENSVDAGAQSIELRLVDGGIKSLRITDDGCGIPREEMPLAVAAHATSKLADVDGLAHITTLGFRGEALASIASVARLTLTSRTADSDHAWSIDASSGEIKPAALDGGTVVTVEDLYYNIPARRKFLRTFATEAAHCETALLRLALSRPQLAVTYYNNQRLVHQWRSGDLAARVGQVLGAEFVAHSRAVAAEAGPLTLTGMVSLPTYTRGSRDQQFLFVNGRYVRDKLLSHAILAAYHDVLHGSRHACHVLFLGLPPELVDVNAHPTKLEVRFRESQAVHHFLLHAIERVLSSPRAPDLAKVHPTPTSSAPTLPSQAIAPTAQSQPIAPTAQAQPVAPTAQSQPIAPTAQARSIVPPAQPTHQVRQDLARYLNFARGAVGAADSTAPPPPPLPATAEPHPLGYAIGQLHHTFLLAQNAHGLVMVDIHAAHERILYERFKGRQRLERQSLAIAQMVQASALEIATAREHQETLLSMGLEISEGGPQALVVRALPTLLKNPDIEALVHEVLDDLRRHGNSRQLQQAADHILSTFACHTAIRAGHALSMAEMNALLRDIESTPRADQCNHGRPVWVQLDHQALDRLFMRGR